MCGHWAALPVRPPKPSPPPPSYLSAPALAPPPPGPASGGTRRAGTPTKAAGLCAPPRPSGDGARRPPPPLPPAPPHPPPPPPSPPNPRHGGEPAPPPARGGGWGRAACIAGRYAESSGQPSSAPRAACEPQDRPSNQIKSNQTRTDPPPYCPLGGAVWGGGSAGGCWGGGVRLWGGFPRWGGLRATHYYHMHTSYTYSPLGATMGGAAKHWFQCPAEECHFLIHQMPTFLTLSKCTQPRNFLCYGTISNFRLELGFQVRSSESEQ